MSTLMPPDTISARTEKHEAASTTRRRAGSSRLPALVLWDLLVPLALFAMTGSLVGSGLFGEQFAGAWTRPYDPIAVLVIVLAPLGLAAASAYRQDTLSGPEGIHRLGRFALVAALVAWVGWLAGAAFGQNLDLAQFAIVSAVLPFGWMAGRWAVDLSQLRPTQRVVVIGTGPVARRIIDLTQRHPKMRVKVVGCIDEDPVDLGPDAPPVIGGLRDLRAVLAEGGVDRVVVAFSIRDDSEILGVLRDCDDYGVSLAVVPRMFDLMGPQPTAHSFGGLAMVAVRGRSSTSFPRLVKRAIDLFGATAILAITSPLMLAAAAAIKATDRGPIFFRQMRVGRDGELFNIVKFRTMCIDAELHDVDHLTELANGGATIHTVVKTIKRNDDWRVTRIGRLLRKTSLDELPQLWNVIRGEMSLVGPRPLRPFEVDSLSGWQLTRQTVPPGITGLWQVLGRSEIDWDERMQLDYDYARHWSLRNDLRILMETVRVVVVRKGAS